jgi:hypothetical protein
MLLVGGAFMIACISVETAPPSSGVDAGGGAETCIAVVSCRRDCAAPAFDYGCGPCPAGNINAALCVGDAGGAANPDAATDAAPLDPNSAEAGLYLATCITTLSSQDPARVLRFYTTVTEDPTQGGRFGVSLKPMKGWDASAGGGGARVVPASVSQQETVGTATKSDNVLPKGGKFVVPLGDFVVPAAANSISGVELTLNATFNGSLVAGRLGCATLTGSLLKPVPVMLQADREVCLFKKVDEGAPIPTYTVEQFVCP